MANWKKVKLEEVCSVEWGNSELTKASYILDGEYLAVSAAGCDGRIGHREHAKNTPVISAIGANCGRMFLPREDFTAIKNTITITPVEGVSDGRYLYEVLTFAELPKRGGAQPFMSKGDIESFKIYLPPVAEQRKIAEILRTWDEAIETAEAELKAKQERKRWLTVSLIFSKGMGAKSKAHKYVPIGNFLREDVDSVDPSQSPDEHFELWSIPAHDKGVADYVKGFQVGSHKKLVNPGDVLISKIVPHIQRSRVVGRSERKCRVIASTEWIVFGGGKIEAEYLREVLISEDFHRKFMETVTGVGGSLARANVKAVAKIKIPFPSIQEQRNIADVLLCAGADEGAITQRIESLRAQKRGLMQKLLTGEVRVAA